MENVSTKVVTGKVRFSYAEVFEPKAIGESSDLKYSVSLLIRKDDAATIKKITDAVEAVIEQNKEKFYKGGKRIPKIKLPLRDGDEERPDDENYAGHFFVNANSRRKPQIVDSELNEIMSRDEFYSGCYGRASINFYAFDRDGNKGVACGLNNLQKLEDGENLAGASSAADDFADELA